MRRVVRWVRALLSAAGAAALLAASALFPYLGWRVRHSDSPLAALGFLLPIYLAALGLALFVVAWRWRWALAGALLAAASFALALAIVRGGR